jgi:hypothetical protein
MFEKITNAAETLATNVGESRRGFLARVGQAALGVAGVVAGLLASPTEGQAQAGSRSGLCQITFRPGALVGSKNGFCISGCLVGYTPSQCRGTDTYAGRPCGRYNVGFTQCTF